MTAAQPETCSGDVIVVLDADARIEPWFLRRAAGYFAAGANAVTARRRILDSPQRLAGGGAGGRADAGRRIEPGPLGMGGCSEFRGNGIMVRRELLGRGRWLEGVGLDRGHGPVQPDRGRGRRAVAWAIDAQVWEEPVRRVGQPVASAPSLG